VAPGESAISKALSCDVLKQQCGAFGVVESALNPLAVNFRFCFAMVVAEIKFSRVALKMCRAGRFASTYPQALRVVAFK
jgi:hypothetical protein